MARLRKYCSNPKEAECITTISTQDEILIPKVLNIIKCALFLILSPNGMAESIQNGFNITRRPFTPGRHPRPGQSSNSPFIRGVIDGRCKGDAMLRFAMTQRSRQTSRRSTRQHETVFLEITRAMWISLESKTYNLSFV